MPGPDRAHGAPFILILVIVAIAVVAGAISVLLLGLVIRRGGPGRTWLTAGLLVISVASQVDWYGLRHGWPVTHHYVGALVILAFGAGMASALWGIRQAARAAR